MDFRFGDAIARHLAEQLGTPLFDSIALPGGVKYILEGDNKAFVRSFFDIARRLHGVSAAVLVNHEDCGGYGGASRFASRDEERAFHKNELERAREIVERELGIPRVTILFAGFSDDGANVTFTEW